MAIYWKWVIRSVPGLLGGLLMWASQVTPEQAGSNLAAWLIWTGVDHVPTWLVQNSADTWGLGIGSIGILLSLIAIGLLIFRGTGHQDSIYKFQNLLDRGNALLDAGQDGTNLQVAPWISKVILWDQDVRELLRVTAPVDLLMYKNMGQQPEIYQDREIVLATLRDRRNKLRLIMGRVVTM